MITIQGGKVHYDVVIGPAGSRAIRLGVLGPGQALNAKACPLPTFCTKCTK